MQELAERVAVITGAASGIGRGIAEAAAAKQMRLVLADIEPKTLDAAADALRAAGAEVAAVPTDVSDAGAVTRLGEAALDHFGAVHLVCNNAGVLVAGSLWENSLDELRWSVDVNLWGVIHGIRTFVPILLEQGGEGHIVNTASMAGLTAAPYLDIYNATKHAVVALSETLHKELAMLESGVGVSVVCPGLIQTRIMESARNQPGTGDRDPDARTLSEGGNFITGFLSAGIDDGWPPSRVADAIFDAVAAQRFYVIPAQEPVKAGLYQRLDELREERNPALPGIFSEPS
ncbi:MAG: SDR family NAD(P)-dependent oxidoreductase [Myxococcota bacterium]